MSGMKFSPKPIKKKKTRPYYCSVSGCNSNSGKNRDLSFHTFPRLDKQQPVKVKNYFGNFNKINRCDAWKRALKIKTVNKRAMVCSLHFNYDDYTKTLDASKPSHILKKNAVPSCNLPTTYEESPRDKRYGARSRQKEKEENNIEKNSMDLEVKVEDNNVDSTVE